MRARLEDAGLERIELKFGDDASGHLTLTATHLRQVSGNIEIDSGAGSMRNGRAASARVDELSWTTPAGWRVGLAGRATATALEVDGHMRPTSGRASVGRAEGQTVTVERSPGGRAAARVAARVAIDELDVEQSPEQAGHVAAERIELNNLQATGAGLLLRASSARVERARLDWQPGSEVLAAAAAGVATGVIVDVGGATIEIDQIELPDGIRTSGRTVAIPEVRAQEARIAIDDLAALVKRAVPPRAEEGRPVDVGFLDRVTGRLDVDMTMELSIPVLGRREATHHFRIPIVDGVINYRELERDLANFEDAFIDLEVRGRELHLERAIPLIPGLEKPLVRWELDDDELELARQRLIRLRTVPRLRLPPRGDKAESGKSSVAIRRVALDRIEAALALEASGGAGGHADDGGASSRGWLAGFQLGELRADGALEFEPHRPTEPTTVAVEARSAKIGPFSFTVGSGRVDIDSLEVGSVTSATAQFVGFWPARASLIVRDLCLRGLRLTP